jgi:hypothetical protein
MRHNRSYCKKNTFTTACTRKSRYISCRMRLMSFSADVPWQTGNSRACGDIALLFQGSATLDGP